MADASPTRRSGRQRVPNKKYSSDAFKILNAVLSSDSEEEEFIQQQQQLQDDSDEFTTAQLQADGQESEESVADDASDGSEIATPVEDYEDAHSYASSQSDPAGKTNSKYPNLKGHKGKGMRSDVKTHSRGMVDKPMPKDNAEGVVKVLAGAGTEDILHIVKSRDQWAADPMVPRKSSFRLSFSHSDEQRQMEATVGWDWYYDQGGRDLFAARQMRKQITADEASSYVAATTNIAEFFMGPYGKQQAFSLAHLRPLNINQAFMATEHDQSPREQPRRGWIVNAGARIQCLEWAPNHEGSKQYLAIATSELSASKSLEIPPAFTPLPAPSCIQLWVITNTSDSMHDVEPTPTALLCSDWGDVQQMKWCPVPRVERMSSTSSTSIGLLAGVWRDGFARVLDVQLDETGKTSSSPLMLKYDHAAFTAAPPAEHLSTCLTWLSASDLAIGYSNGDVAIFDICPSAKPRTSETIAEGHDSAGTPSQGANPSPWLSMPFHTTYVLTLTSAYPSHPDLLISSSMSGYARLTSLLAPTVDYCLSHRNRSPPAALAYCDPLLSVVGMEDNSETIRLWALRYFYASTGCGILYSSPGPGPDVVDVGKSHPTVAAGSADGSVIITNPIRKVHSKKRVGYQLKLYGHEWRPHSPIDGTPGQRHGISRFTEGYKPVKVTIGNAKTLDETRDRIAMTTIHEKETAVTALAWNPNVSCGGWLAVGWASGLIRVQDVALQ